jgi:hypothetical protein
MSDLCGFIHRFVPSPSGSTSVVLFMLHGTLHPTGSIVQTSLTPHNGLPDSSSLSCIP